MLVLLPPSISPFIAFVRHARVELFTFLHVSFFSKTVESTFFFQNHKTFFVFSPLCLDCIFVIWWIRLLDTYNLFHKSKNEDADSFARDAIFTCLFMYYLAPLKCKYSNFYSSAPKSREEALPTFPPLINLFCHL